MIRHEEITRPVWWRHMTGYTALRQARFVAVLDDDELLAIRLVGADGLCCTVSRQEAVTYGQPVEEWEADAATCYQPGKVPL